MLWDCHRVSVVWGWAVRIECIPVACLRALRDFSPETPILDVSYSKLDLSSAQLPYINKTVVGGVTWAETRPPDGVNHYLQRVGSAMTLEWVWWGSEQVVGLPVILVIHPHFDGHFFGEGF